MEQKDYLLREIEKLWAILNALRQKILEGKANSTVAFEEQMENAKAMLLNEVSFDFDKLLNLSAEESSRYIINFEGFNTQNIELLAEYVAEIGFNDECDNPKKYLEKALQLYELCNLKSKAYSVERETNIRAIKEGLEELSEMESKE